MLLPMKAVLINSSATDCESVYTCREQGWLELQPAAGPRYKLLLPACVSLHTLRREQTQLSRVVPNSSATTQPLAQQAHQGESKIRKKVQSQALSPDSTPQTKVEAAITCKRNQLPQGPCSNSCALTPPLTVWWWHWAEKKPQFAPGSGFSPPTPPPSLLPVWQLPVPRREDMVCADVRSSSPPKATGHMQGCSHTRTHFQDQSR